MHNTIKPTRVYIILNILHILTAVLQIWFPRQYAEYASTVQCFQCNVMGNYVIVFTLSPFHCKHQVFAGDMVSKSRIRAKTEARKNLTGSVSDCG